MGTLLERNRGILARIEQPRPAAGAIAEVLRRGKREQLAAGVDAAGSPYAPLARSTLRRPRDGATPLLPRGAASGLVVGYVVDVVAGDGRLVASAGWPGRPYVRYLRSGTRRMPARDPGGFRPEDLAECLTILREHVLGR